MFPPSCFYLFIFVYSIIFNILYHFCNLPDTIIILLPIAVEGRFGVGKRKYGLGLIKSKLKEISETDINVSILVLNLDKLCTAELARIKNKYRINRDDAA